MKNLFLLFVGLSFSGLSFGNAKEGTHPLPGYPKTVKVRVPISPSTLRSRYEPGGQLVGPATIYWITWKPSTQAPLAVTGNNHFSGRVGGSDFSADLLSQAAQQGGTLEGTLTVELMETNVTRGQVCERYVYQILRLKLESNLLADRMDGSVMASLHLGAEDGPCSN
jgi:hypothetical protein